MLNLFKSKFFKFAAFAANAQGMKQVQPVVVHRNGNTDLFGRFVRHR